MIEYTAGLPGHGPHSAVAWKDRQGGMEPAFLNWAYFEHENRNQFCWLLERIGAPGRIVDGSAVLPCWVP